MLDPDMRLRLIDSAVTWREVEGEVVALSLERSEYLSANQSGAALWRMLAAGGASPRALAGALAERWGLEPERALADAQAFVGELAARGLVEPFP
ncbi:MAG: PqqD family protein [Solirubrobacteraceae bacterium]